MPSPDPLDKALDNVMGPPSPAARTLAGVQDVAPENAAQALQPEHAALVPPNLGMYDPAPVKGMADAQRARTILSTSPAIQQWASGDPAKVAATKDDFPALHKTAGKVSAWKQGLDALVTPILSELFPQVLQGMLQGKNLLMDLPGEAVGMVNNQAGRALVTAGAPVPGRDVRGGFLGVWDAFKEDFGITSPSENQAKTNSPKMTPEQAAQFWGSNLSVAESFIPLPEHVPNFKGEPIDDVEPLLLSGPKPSASPAPPRGTDPFMDAGRTVLAEQDALHVQKIENALVETKTLTRSPALAAEFVQQQSPGALVWLDPDAVAELYSKQEVTPGPDDGLLGHVPGFLVNLEQGLKTGQDIQIPLGDYIAATAGKPHADAFRDIARFREDGVSIAEGKDLAKLTPSEEPPVEGEAPTPQPQFLLPDLSDLHPEEQSRALTIIDAAKTTIARVVKAQYLHALFKDAEAAGMTQDQFARYSKRIVEAQATAHDKIVKRAIAQVKRERRPDWQEALAQNKAAVEQELFARGDVQAAHAFLYGTHPNGAPLDGSFALDKSDAIQRYGQALVDQLPAKLWTKGGFSADDYAELFGYQSGDAMLREIAALETAQRSAGISNLKDYVKKVVEGQAHNLTGDALGFDLTPENIEQEVQGALAETDITDFLSEELRTLAKQVGLALDKNVIKVEAERLFGGMRTKDAMNLKAFERTAMKTGRKAEIALLKNNPIEAFRAKQQQLINQYQLAEAHRLVKDYAKTLKKWTRWARKAAMPNVSQEFMNYVHAELMRMGYPVKRNEAELLDQLKGRTLDSFVEERNGQGHEIINATFPATPAVQMTADEYRGARDTLASLVHNGRRAEGVIIDGKIHAFEALRDEIKENGDALGRKLTPDKLEKLGVSGTLARAGRGLNAPMIRMEQLLDEVDRNDPLGPLNRAVIQPTQAAKGKENDLLAWATKEFKAFGKTQPKEWLGTMKTRIDVPELLWHNENIGGLPERRIVTKGQLVKAALYRGNPSNLAKLLEGYGWDVATLDSVFDRLMSKADWDFVQKVWDLHEHLWPDIASLYRNLSGVAPTKIEPVAFSTPHGPVKGGYFSISYDKLRAPEVHRMSKDSIWGEDYGSSLPSNPYTKGRTAYVAPVALNFEGLNATLGQIIHDLAFRESLMQAQKVLMHPVTRAAIQDNFGPEYTAQLRPWLEYAAREAVTDDKSNEWISSFAQSARVNMTFVGLAYRMTSASIHFSVALSDSVAEVGAKDFLGAIGDLFRSPKQWNYWLDYVSEHSPEVRHRLVNMDQNVREAMKVLTEKQGFLDDVQKYGYHMLALSDNMSAVPTWLAAVKQETARGRSPEEAFTVADKRVRQAHGASASIDLPSMQRGGHSFLGEIGRSTIGMFLSFMNHSYNRLWAIGREYGRAGAKAKAGEWAGASRDFSHALARTMFYTVVPAVAVTMIHGWASGRKHLGFNDWVDGIAHTTFGGYPGVGILLDQLDHKDSQSPIEHAVTDQGATLRNTWAKITGHDDKVSKRWLQQAMQSVGYWTGKVPGQAAVTSQYLWDFSTGLEHPKDVNEFLRGVVAGPKGKGKKK